ncbi:hypothetical protein [Methylosinus sp. R-45379]|uniref:hypothetical protein n=1 Tax=Methylosinus sp. R-45379 TaxID=980563 RepID=UPI0007C893B0|nr:hypothetical protein [Methylosinus sp. R-45379]
MTEELSPAVRDIIAERRRQVDIEGWTPAHDDKHIDRSLAMAAASYAIPPNRREMKFHLHDRARPMVPATWPISWSPSWWKPKSHRRDLIRAGALIVAEIERLDREAAAAI